MRPRAMPLFAAALLLAAAAARPSSASERPVGRSLARRAARAVGHRSLRELARAYPDDCTGLVRWVYAGAGIELLPPASGAPGESASAAIYRRARRRGALRRRAPRAGDLVFFHDTYDRNRDGRRDDGITHVGVVESVSRQGVVVFVHRAGRGIVRSRLDVRHPHVRRDRRRRLHNDVLRRASRGQRAQLTGELVAGFASPSLL